MIKKQLDRIAETQIQHTNKILIAALAVTIFFAAGIPKIQLQTDFQDSLPDEIDAVAAQDKVENNFGSTNSIIILLETNNQPAKPTYITDIREPEVIRSLNFLDQTLEREQIISSSNSMAGQFSQTPETKQQVKNKLNQTQASFTNRDYTATTVFVDLSEEMTEENIAKAVDAVETGIKETPKYPGLDITITGTPVVRTTLSDVLVSDSIKTISAASLLILALLTLSRGIVYGPATFVPLFAGLIWTLGFMGHAGIPLSFATISLGSMILGLGVEYGSFITERMLEEMEQNTVYEAARTTIPNTGKAIVGSSLTDGLGFLALLLASISFIRDLGIALALGELLTVTSALIVTPALIITYERWKNQ